MILEFSSVVLPFVFIKLFLSILCKTIFHSSNFRVGNQLCVRYSSFNIITLIRDHKFSLCHFHYYFYVTQHAAQNNVMSNVSMFYITQMHKPLSTCSLWKRFIFPQRGSNLTNWRTSLDLQNAQTFCFIQFGPFNRKWSIWNSMIFTQWVLPTDHFSANPRDGVLHSCRLSKPHKIVHRIVFDNKNKT